MIPNGEGGGPVTRNLLDKVGGEVGEGLEMIGGGGAVTRNWFGKFGVEKGGSLEILGGGGAGGISGGCGGDVGRNS